VKAPRPRLAPPGFTTFEVLVVLVVLAVIAAIAAPGMRGFMISQRVQALSNDLATDLMLARSEALKRSATAQLAPRQDGLESGWTVSAGNTVLGWRGDTGGVEIVDAPPAITFNSNGRVSSPTTRLRMTVRADTDSSPVQRCVEVDLSGRVRNQPGACS
jgi:type IV fimbrial biogenesis protein FimT